MQAQLDHNSSESVDQLLNSLLGSTPATPENKAIALRCYMLGLKSVRQSNNSIIVLIHGMNTYAKWQELAAKAITEADKNIKVYPIKFEKLDALNFLYLNRFAPVNRVLEQLRGIAAENEGANISVIAHSFGTYILMKILKNNSDIKLHRVILCGSVIPRSFKWQNLARFPTNGIINEVGTRDFWPVMARFFTIGYGSSGAFGFGSYKIKDRYHDCAHSGFFEDAFIKKYWLPFILNGETVESDWCAQRPDVPWYISLLDSPLFVWPILIFIGYKLLP